MAAESEGTAAATAADGSPNATDGQPHSARSRTFSIAGADDTLYEELGLTRQATPDDIKRAYRRLALRYHPDKNPDDPDTAEKFKQINYANNVLSNPKKRKMYDMHGQMGLKMIDMLGEENLGAFMALHSIWAKIAFFTCCIFTGCYCCCCCCCCCNCCCGKCRPKPPSDMDYNEYYGFADETSGTGDGQPQTVITDQPSNGPKASPRGGAQSSSPPPERPTVIAMPPPPNMTAGGDTNETSPLNGNVQSEFDSAASPPPQYGATETGVAGSEPNV